MRASIVWWWLAAVLGFTTPALAQPLELAVLPSSRSVQVGQPATAFATVINAGSTAVTGCSIGPGVSLPAAFSYQATDPATNQVVGPPNAPFDLAAGGSQSLVFALTPTMPIAPTDVPLVVSCQGGGASRVLPGVNTLLLSASTAPGPDVIAIAATESNDGIATASADGNPVAFSVAAVNLGEGGELVVSLDTGASVLPVSLAICRSNSGTGLCLEPPTSSVRVLLDSGAIATFSVFASATGSVALDPARSRIFVRFAGADGPIRGATSVALATGATGWSDKVTTTPSLVQTDFGKFGHLLPLDGEISCGETAIAMSMLWLGKNGFTQLAPAEPTDRDGLELTRIFTGMAEVCFYTGQHCGTLVEEDWYRYTVETYLALKGIAPSQVRWERAIGPDVSWLDQQNQNQTIVNFAVGWYQRMEDGKYEREGQHWLTLLDQDPATGVLTINNPYPESFFDVPNVPTSNPQEVPTAPFSGETIPQLPPGNYIQTDTPVHNPASPIVAVLETGYSWTIDPAAMPTSPGYAPQPFTLAPLQYVNNYTAPLEVLAPLTGPGGLLKYGPADLILTAPNTTTGDNEIREGLLVAAHPGSAPFGTGNIALSGDGGLKIAPRGAAGDVTIAGGDGSTLSYAGGNRLVLDAPGPLALTIGGFTDGATPNLVRKPGGSLIIAPQRGLADLGSGTQVRIAGSDGNLPPVTHGMVSPSLVGQATDAFASGAFLTYGPAGFVRATTVSSLDMPIGAATGAVYALESTQALEPGETASIHALLGGPHAITSADQSTVLRVGSQDAGDEAGLILNGTAIEAAHLELGAAEGLIYTSRAGGRIASRIATTGGLTLFGPGELTLTGANDVTGPVTVNSGTVVVANTAGVGLDGPVNVAAGGTLVVRGEAARITGPVSIAQDSSLVLDGGTVGALVIDYGGYLVDGGVLEGHGTVAGQATVSGTVRAGSSIGTTTFLDQASFSDAFVWITLSALSHAPERQGVDWNAFDFRGDTAFGTRSDPILLFVDFRGIPDPDSGHPFWNQPHRWPFARFSEQATWQAWFEYMNFDYSAGSFSVDLVNNEAVLVYTPNPPGQASPAKSPAGQRRPRGRPM